MKRWAILFVIGALCLSVCQSEQPAQEAPVPIERANAVTFGGQPMTLVGPELKVGDPAPDATVVANNLSTVSLASYRGKVCVISVVPSLDTGLCDYQTRYFNEAAAGLGKDVVILTISMDLPFAQARWCGAAGVKSVVTLSDHRYASFGAAYGVLIKELRLLGRAVFVVDKKGVIQYVQVMGEIGSAVDYNAALAAVAELTK